MPHPDPRDPTNKVEARPDLQALESSSHKGALVQRTAVHVGSHALLQPGCERIQHPQARVPTCSSQQWSPEISSTAPVWC